MQTLLQPATSRQKKKAPNNPGWMRVYSVAIRAQDDSRPSWPSWSSWPLSVSLNVSLNGRNTLGTHYRSRHPVPDPIKCALAGNVLLRVATYSTVV